MPDVAAALPGAMAEHASAETERRWTYEAIALFLRRMCARQPVLLVLDDLHHASMATIELLHYLAARSGSGRLLALATVRAEEGRHVLDLLGEVAEQVEVGPLDPAAVARLAAAAGHAELAARSGSAPGATRCSWSRRCGRWRRASRASPPRCGPACWRGYGARANRPRSCCAPRRSSGRRSPRRRWRACSASGCGRRPAAASGSSPPG
nr:hypothetical protein GCM10020093_002070 [Planobispora longispora]